MGGEEARLLALGKAGVRTLIRWEKRCERDGVMGCADDRWLNYLAKGGKASLGRLGSHGCLIQGPDRR
jgi:hypothetical protein